MEARIKGKATDGTDAEMNDPSWVILTIENGTIKVSALAESFAMAQYGALHECTRIGQQVIVCNNVGGFDVTQELLDAKESDLADMNTRIQNGDDQISAVKRMLSQLMSISGLRHADIPVSDDDIRRSLDESTPEDEAKRIISSAVQCIEDMASAS